MMWEGEDDVESDLRTCIPTGPHRSPMSYTRVMGGEGCGLSGGERRWVLNERGFDGMQSGLV